MILRGKRMPGTEDGQARSLQARASTQRYSGYRLSAEAGRTDRRRRRARQGFRPRGRDMAAAPESVSPPVLSPLRASVVVPPQSRIPLDDFAVPACDPG